MYSTSCREPRKVPGKSGCFSNVRYVSFGATACGDDGVDVSFSHSARGNRERIGRMLFNSAKSPSWTDRVSMCRAGGSNNAVDVFVRLTVLADTAEYTVALDELLSIL